MRTPLLLLLALGCMGGVAWLVLSGDEPAPGDPDFGGTVIKGPQGPKPVPMEVPLPAVVVDEEPEDLFHHQYAPGTDVFQRLELLQREFTYPKNLEKLTGELVLRILATELGSDVTFRFVGQGLLEKFKETEFFIQPHRSERFEGLLAQVHQRGFRPMERDGQYWILSLEKDRPPPP